MTNRLMRVNEVLEKLAISRSTLYELTRRGELTPVRLGRATRFNESDVARLMEPATAA